MVSYLIKISVSYILQVSVWPVVLYTLLYVSVSFRNKVTLKNVVEILCPSQSLHFVFDNSVRCHYRLTPKSAFCCFITGLYSDLFKSL